MNAGYNPEVMKKKKNRTPSAEKRVRSGSKREAFPDNDPEWDSLEERYSQINDDMRKLAEMLTLK